MYAHIWNDETHNSWPGEPLSPIATNEFGQGIYELEISINDNVIFNGDNEGQTVEIAVADISFNAIYCMDETDESGHYYYDEWEYTPQGPQPTHSGATIGKMYMIPSAQWKSEGARFAAYFFEGSDYVWKNMKYAGDNKYSVDVPEGFSSVIFVRMDGASTENNWDNKWSQTDDLPVDPGSTYTVVGWGK